MISAGSIDNIGNLSSSRPGPPAQTAHPKVPEMELLERIGSGAYGEVWLARNAATGARRALKIVYRATFTEERPFNREFEGIKKFESLSHSHPSQLSLFQVGRNVEAGYFYYVMELADSVANSASYQARTLRSELAQGRLPAARCLEIALALTEALAHLHANGLIHRDVKPSNIIFVQGRPKLADIGLVTDASDSRSIVGTEGYLPNEGPGTFAADIFALGKVLYEALTGQDRRQFPHLPAELRDWSDAALVFELNEILLKACAADARQRYPTADSMLADLQLLHAGKSLKRWRSLQQVWTWSWKSAVVISAITLGLLMYRNERNRSAELARLRASPFESSGTTNLAAWNAVQRAVQMVQAYNVHSMSNSAREFETAVDLDPTYSEAWSTLATLISLQVDYGYLPASNALMRAKTCAETAIKLKPANAFAYCAVAEITLAQDYDFPAAERIYRKGLALDPQNIAAHHNFARLLVYYSRFEEAEALLSRVLGKIPGNPNSYTVTALVYAGSRRFQEALSTYDQSARLNNTPYVFFNRADLLSAMNDRPAAARDLLRVVELHGHPSLDPLSDGASLRRVLDEAGPEHFLRQLIQMLEARRNTGQFVSAYDLARLHAHAGHRAEALKYLEAAVDEHRGMVLSTKVNPLFNDYHREPRFQAVLRRLKLEK